MNLDGISDTKPWYVGERLRGFGWPVKAHTFLDRHDPNDDTVGIIRGKDEAEEIAESHNTKLATWKLKSRLRAQGAQVQNGNG